MGTTPLFFGDAQKPLFGAYHAPAAGTARRVGVLLCYPAPQEYMFAHRAFRVLAETLAERGFPVLRFDYSGTGDSSGDLDTATFGGWRADVRTAADELCELGNVNTLSIVGMRLGAAIAMSVAAEGQEARARDRAVCDAHGRRFRDLVLWDPIVDGSRAIAELRAIDHQRLAMSHVKREAPADELCGFAFPAHLRRELGRLNLLELPQAACNRVSILSSAEDKDCTALYERLVATGNDASLRVVHDPESIEKRASLGESLLSRKLIDAVVERIVS